MLIYDCVCVHRENGCWHLFWMHSSVIFIHPCLVVCASLKLVKMFRTGEGFLWFCSILSGCLLAGMWWFHLKPFWYLERSWLSQMRLCWIFWIVIWAGPWGCVPSAISHPSFFYFNYTFIFIYCTSFRDPAALSAGAFGTSVGVFKEPYDPFLTKESIKIRSLSPKLWLGRMETNV